MDNIVTVKGTHDVINDEAIAYQEIELAFRELADLYGYLEFKTPVLEYSKLFTRSVGESSDIVRKEMYEFLDKGGRSVSLRPEFTASIVRAAANAKLFNTQDLPIKAFYVGPAFRYERPQAGRYRQFYQLGLEALGERSPILDAEIISFGYKFLQLLGFKNLKLKINTLGDDESKSNYKKAIKEYFKPHLEEMCSDCKERYELNPLRILDCKVPSDIELVKNAPSMKNYLTSESKEYYSLILDMLNELQIPFEEDDSLVRGLDYYSDVVFEYHFYDEEGKSIGALGAGGHYDKLIGELSGINHDGVGLAFGLERLYSVLQSNNLLPDMTHVLDVMVMPISDNEVPFSYIITEYIRDLGYKCDISYSPKSLKSQFKKAERKNTRFALIVGEDELKTQTAILKNMETQVQEKVPLQDLADALDKHLINHHSHEGCECGCENDDDCDCDCEHDHEHEHECCCHHHKEEE